MSRGLEVSGFYGDEISFQVLTNHLTQNPSWWYVHCAAKMDASEKGFGGGRTRGVSF